MPTDPEDTIIARIGTLAAWTENTNLFKGFIRPLSSIVPQTAVFVNYSGGPEPVNFAQGGASPQEYEHAVQVLIRGEPEQYGSTRALADAIWVHLHDYSPGGGYFSVRATTSAPVFVDQDEVGSYIFVINMRLHTLE